MAHGQQTSVHCVAGAAGKARCCSVMAVEPRSPPPMTLTDHLHTGACGAWLSWIQGHPCQLAQLLFHPGSRRPCIQAPGCRRPRIQGSAPASWNSAFSTLTAAACGSSASLPASSGAAALRISCCAVSSVAASPSRILTRTSSSWTATDKVKPRRGWERAGQHLMPSVKPLAPGLLTCHLETWRAVAEGVGRTCCPIAERPKWVERTMDALGPCRDAGSHALPCPGNWL